MIVKSVAEDVRRGGCLRSVRSGGRDEDRTGMNELIDATGEIGGNLEAAAEVLYDVGRHLGLQ